MLKVLDDHVEDLWMLTAQDCRLGKLVNTLAKGKVVEDAKLAGDARYWTCSLAFRSQNQSSDKNWMADGCFIPAADCLHSKSPGQSNCCLQACQDYHLHCPVLAWSRLHQPISKCRLYSTDKRRLFACYRTLINKWTSLLGNTPAAKQAPRPAGTKPTAAVAKGLQPLQTPRAQSGGTKGPQNDVAHAGPGRRPSAGWCSCICPPGGGICLYRAQLPVQMQRTAE